MANAKSIVFVVDDDVSVRESLELLIQSEGWQPKTFASGREFLDCPPALVANCLLLDISLPGMNGLDLQKRIAIERTHLPIIFITGSGDVPKSVQAMKAGAGTKPRGSRSGDGDEGTPGPLRVTYSSRTGGHGVSRLRAVE